MPTTPVGALPTSAELPVAWSFLGPGGQAAVNAALHPVNLLAPLTAVEVKEADVRNRQTSALWRKSLACLMSPLNVPLTDDVVMARDLILRTIRCRWSLSPASRNLAPKWEATLVASLFEEWSTHYSEVTIEFSVVEGTVKSLFGKITGRPASYQANYRQRSESNTTTVRSSGSPLRSPRGGRQVEINNQQISELQAALSASTKSRTRI